MSDTPEVKVMNWTDKLYAQLKGEEIEIPAELVEPASEPVPVKKMKALTPEEQAQLDDMSEDNVNDIRSLDVSGDIARKMMSMLLHEKDVLAKYVQHLDYNHWELDVHKVLHKILVWYFNKYGDVPSYHVIYGNFEKVIEEKDAKVQKYFLDELEQTYNNYKPGEAEIKYLCDVLEAFLEKQQVRLTSYRTLDWMKKENWQEYREEWTKPLEFNFDEQEDGILLSELADIPDPVWQVEDFWTTKSLGLIYGPSGCGKSFLALDLSLSVATGKPYLGKYPVAKGSVVYIAAEGHQGMKKRIPSWAKHNQSSLPTNFLLMGKEEINMMEPSTPQKLLAVFDKRIGGIPDLVVIDTLSRTMGSGNENDSKDMPMFVANITRLQRLGCAVLVIHHTGKDATKGSRGHTSLYAAMDSVFETKGSIDALEVICRKQKDSEEMEGFIVGRERVDNSLVLSYGGTVSEAKQEEKVANEAAYDEAMLAHIPVSTLQLMDESEGAAGITRAGLKDKLPKVGKNKINDTIKALRDKNKISGKKYGSGANAPEFLWQEELMCCFN